MPKSAAARARSCARLPRSISAFGCCTNARWLPRNPHRFSDHWPARRSGIAVPSGRASCCGTGRPAGHSRKSGPTGRRSVLRGETPERRPSDAAEETNSHGGRTGWRIVRRGRRSIGAPGSVRQDCNPAGVDHPGCPARQRCAFLSRRWDCVRVGTWRRTLSAAGAENPSCPDPGSPHSLLHPGGLPGVEPAYVDFARRTR